MATREPRPSLTTLWKLRHARTDQASAALAAIRQRRTAAEATVEGVRGDLAGTRMSGADGFAMAVARRGWLSAALTSSSQVLAAIVAEEDAAASRYHAERRSELVIEKLLERIDAEHRAAMAKAEQGAMDELALTRHARQQHLAARRERDGTGEAA